MCFSRKMVNKSAPVSQIEWPDRRGLVKECPTGVNMPPGVSTSR